MPYYAVQIQAHRLVYICTSEWKFKFWHALVSQELTFGSSQYTTAGKQARLFSHRENMSWALIHWNQSMSSLEVRWGIANCDCGRATQWKVGMKLEFLQDKGTIVISCGLLETLTKLDPFVSRSAWFKPQEHCTILHTAWTLLISSITITDQPKRLRAIIA